MSLLDILPTLPHQEGMVSQPELRHPAERCDEVSCYDAGRHPVCSRGLSRVVEGNPSVFYRQTGDVPPGDLIRGPLKEE